jgi:hypothetical protein
MKSCAIVSILAIFLIFAPRMAASNVSRVTSTPDHIPGAGKLVISDTSPQTLKMAVQAQFADEPIMIAIAACESSYRQFQGNGEVLHGHVNPDDTGLFQISRTYWLDTANQLGYDIDTVAGNIAMARYIYEKQGTTPWDASKSCWGKDL